MHIFINSGNYMSHLRLISLFILIFIGKSSFCQKPLPKEWFDVLNKNIVGKEFIFNKSIGESTDKTWLKYLGTVTTEKGESYKILSTVWIWGISKRGTTKILLFDTKNKYTGNYALGMTYEAPIKVEKNSIVFVFPKSSGCNSKLIQTVNFNEGIPQTFFVEFKNSLGDIYSFDNHLLEKWCS